MNFGKTRTGTLINVMACIDMHPASKSLIRSIKAARFTPDWVDTEIFEVNISRNALDGGGYALHLLAEWVGNDVVMWDKSASGDISLLSNASLALSLIKFDSSVMTVMSDDKVQT